MKKILSLALALLMLFPLAIGTSAATVNKITTADDFRNLLDLWQWLNQDEKDKYKDLYDYFCGSDYDYDGLVREWKDYCDECGKVAFYYVSKGKVYCSCSTCGKTYDVTPEIETSDKCDYCHKKDCICVEDANELALGIEEMQQRDGELLKFLAVLSVEQPETMSDALRFAINLDDYERITEGTYEYGQAVLRRHGADDELLEAMDGYMDFEKLGEDAMVEDGVRQTEFGLVRRCSTPFPEETQSMQMGGM